MILITGGMNDGDGGFTHLTSVEVLTPSGVPRNCRVPPLPASRWSHTQDGLVACGGGDTTATLTTCLVLTAEGWNTSHQLQQEREIHVSWWSPAGLLLMGGRDSSSTTTEFLTNTSSTPSFQLDYDYGLE